MKFKKTFSITLLRNSVLIIGVICFLQNGVSVPKPVTLEADSGSLQKLATFQDNTLIPFSNCPEPQITQKIKMTITAYTSVPEETDHTPFVTAAGTQTREGIVANNFLALGTRIRIPQIFGNRIFIVEDRMHYTQGLYHIDVWFPSRQEAKNFGVKKTYIEVLEG